MTELLRLDSVACIRGDRLLFENLSWVLNRGDALWLRGPNGAGKSLFLRLCHGLLQPTQGSIRWQQKTGADRHQAMVFQRPVMLRRSVAANIDYALKLRQISRRDRGDIIDRVLHQTGLRRLADQPARVLSIGEQQKLALARAWALEPQVLFLDEPTASLDPAAIHSVEEIMAAIHDAGTRIIMTTHDLGQARRIADEVLFINRGRILEAAPADRFFNAPENDLAQAFLRGELLW